MDFVTNFELTWNPLENKAGHNSTSEWCPIHTTSSKQCHDQHTLLEFTWNLPGKNWEFTWNPPGICLEFAWNLPGIYLESTWNLPGMTWNGPGMDLEWTWNGPGIHLESPGMDLEWTWNGPGMDLEFTWNSPGITWNRAKKNTPFFYSDSARNDLEWLGMSLNFLPGMRWEFTWIPTKFLPFHLDSPGFLPFHTDPGGMCGGG